MEILICFNGRDGFVYDTVNTGKDKQLHVHLVCEEKHADSSHGTSQNPRYLLYRVHVGFPPGPPTRGAREVLIPRTTKRSALYHGVRDNEEGKGKLTLGHRQLVQFSGRTKPPAGGHSGDRAICAGRPATAVSALQRPALTADHCCCKSYPECGPARTR